ncbi:Fic family protein [Sinomonas sp. G460-2]|uniref:Fic family protein n=1 Tax=Sinomonas sp. G460-2 TaxID=3393464 RepID=UPI0039F0188B
MPGNWPAHRYETRPWRPSGRVPREDRLVTEIEVAIPPDISRLDYYPERPTMVLLEEAAVAIASLDAVSSGPMRAISGFLLRSESVSSSKIEHVDARRDDYARAVVGLKASAEARSTVAATDAIQAMIRNSGSSGKVTLDAMLAAHRILMRDDPHDSYYAGKVRDVQNWIGGSDYSPRGAAHVPPPADLVPSLLDDVISFSNRSDMPVVAQAALAHAQFESIHPFTDGNGRIGRALINAVIRRRGLAEQTVTPIASAMLADVSRYFRLVNDYRIGDAEPFVVYLAECAVLAVKASKESLAALTQLPGQWTERAKPRKGSADETLISHLIETPVLDAQTAASIAGVAVESIYRPLNRLTDAGVISPITQSARDRAWAAHDVLDEVDRLAERLRSAP